MRLSEIAVERIVKVTLGLFIVLLLLAASTASGQEKIITGYVRGTVDNQPVSQATVTVKGTKTVALSDDKGTFSIKAAPNQRLVVTAIGFRPVGADPTDAPLLSGHVRDVSVIRNIIENANRYQAKKNSMLEILSHDLASPLVLAQQMSDYFAEKVKVLDDKRLNAMIEEMRLACQEGVDLIRDFVDQEFLESSNVDLKLTRLDLVERLGLLLDNYQQREHAVGHHFHFETSHPSIYADIDENKFLQVINNLLGNALKFTPDGGHLRVHVEQFPSHVLVTVADNGIGIPAALQPVLFERFTRAGRLGLRGEKTTGLGMSIIKTIVELHQGDIWLESAEDQGTTFYIKLPRPEQSEGFLT
jgi:two-component system sensor histidine kinase VicK